MKVVLFILLLLPSVLATDDYFQYSTLDIEGSLISPLTIAASGRSPSISVLTANLTWFPTDDVHQSVTRILTVPESEQVDDSLIFTLKHPSLGSRDFVIDYSVHTSAVSVPLTQKIRFPIAVDPSFIPYIRPGQVIDITDEIRILAYTLASDQDDLFLVVSSLAAWTSENIKYDLTTSNVEASMPSSWVLENRQGVCDELTSLFISLTRSLGIPARFVSGLSYTNSPLFENSWGAHGWAEVYFPGTGWVPFDVTYGQLGWVDATHVKFSTASDAGKYASSYSWVGRDVSVTPVGMVLSADVVSVGPLIDPLLDVDVSVLEDEIGPDSYDVVSAKVSNPTQYYVAEEVFLTPTEGVDIIDPASVIIALPPKGSQTLHWRIHVSKAIDPSYRYTFPVKVLTQRRAQGTDEFTVAQGLKVTSESWANSVVQGLSSGEQLPFSHQVGFNCSASVPSPLPGEQFTIDCLVTNAARRDFVLDVCADTDCQSISLAAGSSGGISFPYSTDVEALHALSLSAHNDVVEKYSVVQFEVVGTPLVDVESVEAPQYLGYDEQGVFHFELSPVGRPQNLLVRVVGSGIDRSWSFEALDGRKVFDIIIPGSVLFHERNEYSVEVSFTDGRDEHYEVSHKVLILQGDASWFERLAWWFMGLFR